MSNRRLLFGLGLALAAVAAHAASPVGAWKGKLTIKMPAVPATANPQQRAAMQKMKEGFEKMRVLVAFKPDHTFTAQMTGNPMAPAGKTDTGKWSQKGNVVTTVDAKAGSKPQSMTLSADGKTMSMVLPGGQGKIVFSR